MVESLDIRAKQVFDEAIDLFGVQRIQYLDRKCGSDHSLRSRVEALLAAAETVDDFLAKPTLNLADAPTPRHAGERPGEVIGPYTLIELIGEGGFGTVFLAEQSQPVRRRVALKIIKPGMDSNQVIARFQAERQALALMEHPHIARVLDAGATESGRPYFAMELVSGEHVTRFCDRHRLTLTQRLDLFRDVCAAVQHAHQKGVIHRDLKPSNILVAGADGKPLAKVIDFGVAKAAAQRLTDRTLTESNQFIGTPEYMSPEQAAGVDVDTRTDIYSLGVLLYELLTGVTPFDRQRLASSGFDGMCRIIRDEEPLRPSARIRGSVAAPFATTPPATPDAPDRRNAAFNPESRTHIPNSSAAVRILDSPNSSADVARFRRTDPISLTRALRGDLDWIVLKCLDKDRSRRYETASALADDIGRCLDHQPVVARPPSPGYKLRKFVRRNRAAVLAGAVAAAALFVAAGVSIAFGLSEARQRVDAENAKTRAQQAETESRRRADELEKVATFQEAQLSGVDPRAMGMKVRATLLDKARQAGERSKLPPDELVVRIQELERLMADSDFTGIALETLSHTFFTPALEAIDQQFEDQPLVRAQLLQSLATTLYDVGLYDAATAPQTAALTIRRETLGDEHPDTLASISAMGLLISAQGRPAEAEAYYREALETRRRVLGDEHERTLSAMHNMASLLQAQGKSAEAEVLYRDILEKRRRILGDEHPDTLTTLSGLGHLLSVEGKQELAEPYYREALEKRRRILGDEHPHTLFAINNMAALLHSQGKLDAALELYEEALEKRRRILGDEHPDTLQSINNLATLLELQQKPAEAEPYYREALETRRRVLGEAHPHTLSSTNNMGGMLMNTGRMDEAEPYVRAALEQRRRLLGPDHQDTLASLNNLGFLLNAQGRHAESETHYREVLDGLRRAGLFEHGNTLFTLINLSSVLSAQGKHTEAIDTLASALPFVQRRAVDGNEHRLGRFHIMIGRVHLAAREFEAARKSFMQAGEIFDKARGTTDQDRLEFHTALIELYEAWHAAEPDQGHDQAAERWRTARDETARPAASSPSP